MRTEVAPENIEVRVVTAERAKGTTVAVRGADFSGSLTLPEKAEALQLGTVVRILVEGSVE